ncbi:MAG: hypothetical protein F7C07_00090 [Desulfurococcales archaeon]|nr:hypothetical protein [Desulfurococcales archaeon]
MSQEQEVREEKQETPTSSELRELKDLVEALRESIIELRSALSEINNPFNVMRKPGKEEDEESSSSEPLIPLSASQNISPHPLHSIVAQPAGEAKAQVREQAKENKGGYSKPEARAAGLGDHESVEAGALHYYPETARDRKRHNALQASVDGGKLRINLPRLIRVMYLVRKKAPKENLDAMIEILDRVGLIPGDLKDVMLKVADLVEKARESGIPPEKQLILLYALAKASGVRDGSLEEEAMGYILDMLDGGEDWEKRQS